MRSRYIGVALLGLISACGEPEASPALIAGDVAYTAAELGALSGEQREELALIAAFGQAAAAERLADVMHPFIARDRRGELLERLAAEVAIRAAGLSEADLREAYLRDPEWELTVRHLVVLSERYDSRAERTEARVRAGRALQRIRAGESFADVAGEVSEEPGAAERGGLLEPGRKGTWVEEFWTAALALDEGDVSDVVETPYGFHVLRLEERRPVPYEEARGRVLSRLVAEQGALGRAEAWADSVAAELEPDAGAIARAQAGTAPRDLPLVRWPGGEFDAGELAGFLATLSAEDRARIVDADAAAFGRVVMGAARNDRLADVARSEGLALDSTTVARIETEWVGRAREWAAALGFAPGQTPEQIKAAALAALDDRSQSAAIARTEVAGLEPSLRQRYRIDTQPAAAERDGAARDTAADPS